jgi:uncharacterized protein YidB (DUF937 family)
MGLFDKMSGALKGMVGQVEAAAPGLITQALANSNLGGLQGVVAQLQKGGLNAQVQSWLSTGANLPVTADQIRAALGNQQVKQLAEQFGLPVDATLKLLAERLPGVVDQASPNGTLQAS